jgi:hypothetical protein
MSLDPDKADAASDRVEARPAPSRATALAIVVAVVIVGAALRISIFPARHDVRDIDEIGYLRGGLVLLEGMSPGYQAAPGGPLTWVAWAYGGVRCAAEFVAPDKLPAPGTLSIRPFVAVDRALFKTHRDLGSLRRVEIILFLVVSIASLAAAAGLGLRYGSIVGAAIVGGLCATLPVFVDLAVQSRPYSAAWSFGILAAYFASAPAAARWRWAAVFFGLAVGSRVEMLLVLPLLLWQLFHAAPRLRDARLLHFIGLTIIVALLAAPWLLTGLIGNLRTIATVQFLRAPGDTTSTWDCVRMAVWSQGLGPVLLLSLAGFWMLVRATRGRERVGYALLCAYALLLCVMLFRTTGFGFHHNGAAVVALLMIAGIVSSAVSRWPWTRSAALIAVVLALPLIQGARTVIQLGRDAVVAPVVQWIEDHVPPGTVIYLAHPGLERVPLPTTQSGDTIWREVSDPAAAERKFDSGLRRAGVSESFARPRALSEVNMVQERGNARMWYILAGQANDFTRRYQIRLAKASPVFFVQDLPETVKREPGVVIWADWITGPPDPSFGEPLVEWKSHSGRCVRIFCPPSLLPTLTPPP